jgi:hypothetical protein
LPSAAGAVTAVDFSALPPSATPLDPTTPLQPMLARVDPNTSNWARLTFGMRRKYLGSVACAASDETVREAPQKGHWASRRFTWRRHAPHGS